MNQKTENLTDKPITEFTPEDTIYIKKRVTQQGHYANYLCQFVKFERGIVTGVVLDAEPFWVMHRTCLGKAQVTARLKSCYLWGHREGDVCAWATVHWFDPKTRKVKV